jgi:NAD(P)-dependent dehydrogenase (short-subunit alcohol dehydrogenase family)
VSQQTQTSPGGGSLDNQRVVVIGGSSGIGLATARIAARQGALVVIVGRSRARLDAALELLPGTLARVADVADESAVERLFADLGAVDHVVLTAGGRAGGRLAEADLAALREDMDIRFWGAVHVCKAAAGRLRADGSITLCSGAVSSKPAPGRSVVSAMVGAVESLGRALALELAPIRVNTIVPGVIDSPRLRGALGGDGAELEERIAAMFRHLPAGRAGSLEEIAGAFLFAMTNSYLTGHRLLVDGGYTLTCTPGAYDPDAYDPE